MTHHSHDGTHGAALCPLFGEQALRDDADMHPHTAAVVAAGPCKLLVLYRWAFAAFLRLVPDAKRRLREMTAKRLRQMPSGDRAR
eukprot:scaffold23905_cov60-Phaeocystis_antarctica.AAC.3